MGTTSLVPAWLRLADTRGEATRVAAWRLEYEAEDAAVFASYHRHWGNRSACDEAARLAPSRVDAVRSAEARARRSVAKLTAELYAAGILLQPDTPTVLLVGGATANGWVTKHRDEPTLFLDLAMFPEAPHDDVLVAHELVHLAQQTRVPEPQDAPLAYTLAMEGVAVAVSRLSRPGWSESAYLWMDNDHDTWVQQCNAQSAQIVSLASRMLAISDQAPECAPLLRDQSSPTVPARSGYWLADQLVSQALSAGTTTVNDLLAMDSGRCYQFMSQQLG